MRLVVRSVLLTVVRSVYDGLTDTWRYLLPLHFRGQPLATGLAGLTRNTIGLDGFAGTFKSRLV